MSNVLRVSEIFHSIQGESTHSGRRCAFIRLSGCDVGCAWCDTGYARDGEGRELTLDMIVEAIRPFAAPLAEITGGEPLLQPAMPELASRLVREGYEVLVETSGTRDISPLSHPVARIMDLKTPSSGAVGRNWWPNLARLRRGDEVKFVIADRGDYEWARSVVGGGDFPRAMVETLFSAVAGRLDPAELAGWILEDRLNARLNIQVHKYLWPKADRGV